jgi:4-hydroxy 2-oxovalerate aldolase
VDATVAGMGRGAGNLKTELLLTVLNKTAQLDVDYNALSEITGAFSELQERFHWGTNLPYMVSGANSLPQKDVMDWVTKRFYSFNGIIRALNNQKTGVEDNMKLPVFEPSRKYRQAVIIGGGELASEHAAGVKEFIGKQTDVCIIHASSKNARYYEDVSVDTFFCLVGNEGHRMENVFGQMDFFSGCCILPPYPRKMGTYVPSKVQDKSFELGRITFTDQYLDSHTVLALQTAIELGVEKVFLAGYDGYGNTVITAKERDLIVENEYSFMKAAEVLSVESLLPTQYTLKTRSLYSYLS